jgi:hypothetical protein
MGHEDAFRRPRLRARIRFSERTFAGTQGNDGDAPNSAVRVAATHRLKSTQNGVIPAAIGSALG